MTCCCIAQSDHMIPSLKPFTAARPPLPCKAWRATGCWVMLTFIPTYMGRGASSAKKSLYAVEDQLEAGFCWSNAWTCTRLMCQLHKLLLQACWHSCLWRLVRWSRTTQS